MIKPIPTVFCLFGSYFIVSFVLYGYWVKALMTGILGSLIFSATLFAASRIWKENPWRAFWAANIFLTLLVGGMDLLSWLNSQNPFVDGHIRPGHYSTASPLTIPIGIALCILTNLL